MLTDILEILFLIVFYLCLFMMVYVIFFYKPTVEDESSEDMNQNTNQDLKENNRIKQAQLWKRELEKYGFHPSLESLKKLSSGNQVESTVIPYRTLFSQDEYYQLSLTLRERGTNRLTESYNGNFQIEALPVAVHVKKLVVHTKHLKDALTIIVNKERGKTLSDKEQEKKEELQKELADCKQEIKSYCTGTTIRSGKISHLRIGFNPYVAMDEEELLTLISSTVKTEKPVFSKVPRGSSVTSPALEEINTFLNEHTLPPETVEELRLTMKLIQQKLSADKENLEQGSTLLEADILNLTARKFHDIEENIG